MKFSTFLVFSFLLFSCCGNNNKAVEAKKVVNPQTEKPFQLTYYQCDYSKLQFDTILSAGDDRTTTEIWGVNKSDIARLPNFDIQSLDTTLIVRRAIIHLQKRFRIIDVQSANYKLERINEQDTSNQKNWFIEVTFLYDKRGYFQKVPLLLDGRIILSNTE